MGRKEAFLSAKNTTSIWPINCLLNECHITLCLGLWWIVIEESPGPPVLCKVRMLVDRLWGLLCLLNAPVVAVVLVHLRVVE